MKLKGINRFGISSAGEPLEPPEPREGEEELEVEELYIEEVELAEEEKMYIIRNTNTKKVWSDDLDGWTFNEYDATEFSSDEIKGLPLPAGAMWEEV
jgi:hypothetical protein